VLGSRDSKAPRAFTILGEYYMATWPISQRAADMENDNGIVARGMRSEDAAKLSKWRKERKEALAKKNDKK